MVVTEADLANLALLQGHDALQLALKRAVVVSSAAISPQVVTMQSQVMLSDEATGERRQVSLVYPAEADAATGRISILDALGMALLGASPGQSVECETAGDARRLRIEEVVYQPEHSLRTFLVVRRG